MAAKCLGLLLAFASALGGVFGTTNDTSSKRTVHESRSEILLQEWNQHHRLAEDVVVPVRIGLTQTNLDKGHDLLMEMSDPSSPSYGKHMTAEEVVDFYAPTNETILTVTEWLVSAGVNHSRILLSANKQWLKFDAPIGELEVLLEAEYYLYQHHSTFQPDVGTEQYSIPDHVREHIDYITPGIRLRSMRGHPALRTPRASPETAERKKFDKRQDDLSNCTTLGMTPSCIAALYNITESNTAVPGNEMGIFAALDNVFNQSDFDLFTKTYASVNGASLNGSGAINGPETAIDVQVAAPIIYPQSFTVWQSIGLKQANALLRSHHGQIGLFNTWLDALDGSYCTKEEFGIKGDRPDIDPAYPSPMWPKREQCGEYTPTNVISISYGMAEAGFPSNYLKRQCNEFMKLGQLGTSVFVASHDYGVGGVGRSIHGIGKNRCFGRSAKIFGPNYPATCPYVTSVGATQLRPGARLDTSEEEVWREENEYVTGDVSFPSRNAQSSGGGFSNVWPTPDWQKAAAQHYLTAHPPKHKSYTTTNKKHIGRRGGQFNRTGRGIPDISAFGDDQYWIVAGKGKPMQNGGSSMSAPLWAAIFTRINEERLLANKSRVGFVNPVLYENPHLMRDVTKGYNWGCKLDHIGFNATEG